MLNIIVKYFCTLSAFVFISVGGAAAQTNARMLSDIEGGYTVNSNDFVVIMRRVEFPGLSRRQIYARAESYLSEYFRDVPIRNDAEGTVVAHGFYPKVHVGIGITTTVINTRMSIMVSAFDGYADIGVALMFYDRVFEDTNVKWTKVAGEYPVNPRGRKKKLMLKVFYRSFNAARKSIDVITESIKNDE